METTKIPSPQFLIFLNNNNSNFILLLISGHNRSNFRKFFNNNQKITIICMHISEIFKNKKDL